jgi:hypothetical protein
VSPVKCDLEFYIPEDDILHSHRRENLKPYIAGRRFPLYLHITVHGLNYNVLYSLYSKTTSFCIFKLLNCYITAKVMFYWLNWIYMQLMC